MLTLTNMVQMVHWIKMLLFLVWKTIHQQILTKEKRSLFLGECQTDWLDDTRITIEDKYPVNIT